MRSTGEARHGCGYRVIGGAVPPLLATVIAGSIRAQIFADGAPEKAADQPLAIAG